MSDNYEKMKVPELKQLLSQRGLPLSGTKPVLISRLRGEEPPKVEKRKLTPNKKKKKGDSEEEDEGSDYEDQKEKEAQDDEEDLSEGETEDTDKEEKEKEEDGLPTDITKMKVVELKEALRKRNLSVSGVKQALVDRLQSSLNGDTPAQEKPTVKRKASDVQEGNVKKKKKADCEVSASEDVNFSIPPLKSNEWRIVSWNVTSFNSICANGFGDYLAKEDPHIICLNETKVKDIPQNKFPGYVSYLNPSSTNSGYSGVGILTKVKPMSVKSGIGNPEHDKDGRVLTAEFPGFYLVASYVPNSGSKDKSTGWPANLNYRMKWDEAFLAYLRNLDTTKPVILCGDLNVAHKEIDLANPKTNTKTAGFTQKERDNFENFLKSGFFDVHRLFYPDKTGEYSFWSRRFPTNKAKNVGWRLDYFIASERLKPSFTQSFIRRNVDGSDHCPIGIHLSTDVKTK